MRAILTYHSIDPSGSVVSLDPRTFGHHVDWLISGSVRVSTLAEILALPPSVDGVALTFDDGFQNFRTEAWPRLRDRGLPVTLFVVSSRVGGTNVWESGSSTVPQLPLLDWEALGRLADEGVMIGSHTETHSDLERLSGDRLAAEVGGSAEEIERRLGIRPTAFCYPYGRTSVEAIALVRERYDWATTTELRPLGPVESPHMLPRLDTYYFRHPDKLAAWGTGRFRTRLWLRRQARRVRPSGGSR